MRTAGPCLAVVAAQASAQAFQIIAPHLVHVVWISQQRARDPDEIRPAFRENLFRVHRVVDAAIGNDGDMRQRSLHRGDVVQSGNIGQRIGRALQIQTFLPAGRQQEGVHAAFGHDGYLFDAFFKGQSALNAFTAECPHDYGEVGSGSFPYGVHDHERIPYPVFRTAAEFVRPAVAPRGKKLRYIFSGPSMKRKALKSGLVQAASGFGIAPEVVHHFLAADFARAFHVP